METISFSLFSFSFFDLKSSFISLTSTKTVTMANEFLIADNSFYSSFFLGASFPHFSILHFLITLTLNIAALVWFTVRIFKVLLYMKLTLEFFPIINPYVWPYSILRWLTTWYFEFWRVFLPPIRLRRSSVSMPVFVAIEALTPVLSFCLFIVNFCTDWLLFLDKAG